MWRGLKAAKVQAWLQWAKACRTTFIEKPPLLVNLDETHLKYNYGKDCKGLVVRRRSLPPGKKHRREQISASEEKAGVTLISFITPEPTVQPKLPQVILGNKHRLTLGMLSALAPPANVHLWREDSSWANKKILCRLVTLLLSCLAECNGTRQISLVLDVASCHRRQAVLSYATRLGIRLLFVPAKLTCLLQPLDVGCFSRLKRLLKQKWRELTIESETGTISHEVWLTAVFDVMKTVLNGNRWKATFKAVGLLGEQFLSARVLEIVGWERSPDIPSDILSEEQLKSVFPMRSKQSRNSLFSWAKPKAKAKAKALAKGKAKAKAAAGHAHAVVAPMVD